MWKSANVISSSFHKFLIAATLSDLVDEGANDDLECKEVRLARDADGREECRDVLERDVPDRRDDLDTLELCDLEALEREATELGPPGVTAVASGSEDPT